MEEYELRLRLSRAPPSPAYVARALEQRHAGSPRAAQQAPFERGAPGLWPSHASPTNGATAPPNHLTDIAVAVGAVVSVVSLLARENRGGRGEMMLGFRVPGFVLASVVLEQRI